ncbi:hypothetical protein CC2G_014479 [Coprinopsis cinerea AmutBmut pab1-1]|nr:hypothetical protein CC2G_014479 [Coprinopsis cinerea AmutBmut pab1-1]
MQLLKARTLSPQNQSTGIISFCSVTEPSRCTPTTIMAAVALEEKTIPDPKFLLDGPGWPDPLICETWGYRARTAAGIIGITHAVHNPGSSIKKKNTYSLHGSKLLPFRRIFHRWGSRTLAAV